MDLFVQIIQKIDGSNLHRIGSLPVIASHCLRSKEFKTYFLALKVTTYHLLLVILLNISFFVWGVCTTCNTHLQWQHNWPSEGRVFGPSHSGLWHISSWILRQLPERERESWRQGNFALHTFPLDNQSAHSIYSVSCFIYLFRLLFFSLYLFRFVLHFDVNTFSFLLFTN